jgi:hypothetical protein
MKFQFSISRLLAATAIVALTFGLARLEFGKDISNYAILFSILAADLGLLVLVAQKAMDFYQILRTLSAIAGIITFIFLVFFMFHLIHFSNLWEPLIQAWRIFLLIPLAVGVCSILGFAFSCKKISRLERAEWERLLTEKQEKRDEE